MTEQMREEIEAEYEAVWKAALAAHKAWLAAHKAWEAAWTERNRKVAELETEVGGAEVRNPEQTPISFGTSIREREDGPHVEVTVWAGKGFGHRGNTGTLVMAREEAEELVRRLIGVPEEVAVP